MLFCMRTTLDLDDRLMRELKKHAADTGQTLTRVVESALRDSLARRKQRKAPAFKLRWITVKGRLQPGVDVSDRASLYDRMEGRS
jgi:hypothetical protein